MLVTQKSAFDSASRSFRGGAGTKARPFSRGGISVEVPIWLYVDVVIIMLMIGAHFL